MKITRTFSEKGVSVWDTVEWGWRTVRMKGVDGEVMYEQEVYSPTSWSDQTVQIVSSKYFYGDVDVDGDVQNGGRENSIKDLIWRVAQTISKEGAEKSYFDSNEDYITFRDELCWLLLHQHGSFNSPVWFNVGLYEYYGITETSDKYLWGWDKETDSVVKVDPYKRPQGSACQPYRSLVSTPVGMVPIGKIVEQDMVGMEVYDSFGTTKVVATKSNGVKKVYKVELRSGNYVEATEDHEIFASIKRGHPGEWKQLKDVKVGDRLHLYVDRPSNGKNGNDDQLNSEAALAGWLLSDGYVGKPPSATSNIVEFETINDDERGWLLQHMGLVFEDIEFNKISEETVDPKIDYIRYRAYGELFDWFINKYQLKNRGINSKIPELMYTANEDTVVHFLKSVFECDGYVSLKEGKSKLIGLSRISEEFVKGLQTLLLRLGIFSRVTKINEKRVNRHDGWKLCIGNHSEIEKFERKIGFISDRKKGLLNDAIQLGGINVAPIQYDTVVNISLVGEEEVYDIQTESGEYLSRNIRIHNCFIISLEDSIDDIWNLMSESARLFKYGSGVGADWSKLRSSHERISGGGIPSGPVSFMKVQDATGGTIKSGGKCLAPHQKVYTAEYGPIEVEKLDEKEFTVLSYHPPEDRVKAKRAQAWKSGVKQVVRIVTDKGRFETSFDHPFRLASGNLVVASELKEGQRLHASSVYIRPDRYVELRERGGNRSMLHRVVARDLLNEKIKGKAVHHIDENPLNNGPNNLKVLNHDEHARLHMKKQVAEGIHIFQSEEFINARHTVGNKNGMYRDSDFWKDEDKVQQYKQKQRDIMLKDRDAVQLQQNSTIKRYLNTGYSYINEGFDISTPEKYRDVYYKKLGRKHKQNWDRKQKGFIKHFGSYDDFLKQLELNNHIVQSVEVVGNMDVYSVEVYCDTPDDKSSESGHTYMIWGIDGDSGSGVFVLNTRRAAIMTTLNVHHPDIDKFITAKKDEELKAHDLIDAGRDGSYNGEAYSSVAFQNMNMSARLTDDFMSQYEKGEEYEVLDVNGNVLETRSSVDVMKGIAEGTYICGDPGVQYADTINSWHTVPNTGPINSSNPCCFVGDTLVKTVEGWIRIEELRDRFVECKELPKIYTYDHDTNKYTTKDIMAAFKSGESHETIILKTKKGLTIQSTPEHMFMRNNGSYSEARHLKPGDYLKTFGGGEDYVKESEIVYHNNPIPVYDIEVEDTHNFVVTNDGNDHGVFVHNSEYLHLDDSACNLASLNLKKFSDGELIHTVRLKAATNIFIIAMDILVDLSGYPSELICRNSHDYRPLGLGFTNLGTLLMSQGIPYDSDEGRAMAGCIMGVIHGQSYITSHNISKTLQPFNGWENNKQPMKDVLHKHWSYIYDDLYIDNAPKYLYSEAENTLKQMCSYTDLGFRNSQVTVLAPTGTISFMMGCDTTGIEPELSLTKYKLLAGHSDSYIKIVNQSVEESLLNLGYDENDINVILKYIEENGYVEGCDLVEGEDLPVFDTSFKAPGQTRCLNWTAHVDMMSACQPFISGAISKTVNVPEDCSVEDIEKIYHYGWEKGLKAIAIYRENSKRSQPLSTTEKKDDVGELHGLEYWLKRWNDEHGELVDCYDDKLTLEMVDELLKRGKEGQEEFVYYDKPQSIRKKLPDDRPSHTHKFSVGGNEGYLHVGFYPDTGEIGEIFITMSKQGSTISGLMDGFATAISMCFQYGVPLENMVNKFTYTNFDPSGFNSNPNITRRSTSILDYIFEYLKLLMDNRRKQQEQTIEIFSAGGYTEVVVSDDGVFVDEPVIYEGDGMVNDGMLSVSKPSLDLLGPVCTTCGGLTQRAGTCFTCTSCGDSTGCG